MPNRPIEQLGAASSSDAAPPTLDYARRTRFGWVRRHRRLLILLTVCTAVGIPFFLYRQPLTRRILWVYWSRQAAAHVIPSSVELTVVDPQKAAKLLAADRDYVAASIQVSSTQPAVAGAYYVPYAFRKLSEFDPRLNIVRYGQMPSPRTVPIVFMGTLRRPDGAPRLVIITTPASSAGDFVQFTDKTRTLVLPLAKVTDAVPQGVYPPAGWPISSPGNVRRRAVDPQSVAADPSNPSHLIFDCLVLEGVLFGVMQRTSEHRKLDAYLQNDDSITFVFHEPLGGGWPGDPLKLNISGDPAVLLQPKPRW